MQNQYKKYWSNQTFSVVGGKRPKTHFNSNFKFESLGRYIDDNTPWHLALNGFFKNLNVEHFFLAFEDHFLINFVNTDIFQKAESIMNNDHTVGKVRLLPKYKSCNYLKTYNCDFYYAEESISTFLTTSLRPSIWNKKLFINLLNNKAVITPHKFETINLNSNFGMKVLVPKDINPIFPDLDAMRFGKPNDQALSPGKIVYDYYQLELQSEDLEVFKNIKDTWENGIQHK